MEMENLYSNDLKKDKENSAKMERKTGLVNKAIKLEELTKYQIIEELLHGLKLEVTELKKVLFEELSVTVKAKDKAERVSKIAFALQSCLNLEDGGDVAKNLTWMYRFIRYSAKRIQDNDCMNYVKPASEVVDTLVEAWQNIPQEKRVI